MYISNERPGEYSTKLPMKWELELYKEDIELTQKKLKNEMHWVEEQIRKGAYIDEQKHRVTL